MGTFGPVLDYQVAHHFRKKVMGFDLEEPVVSRFLTDFGFGPEDLPEDGILDALKT